MARRLGSHALRLNRNVIGNTSTGIQADLCSPCDQRLIIAEEQTLISKNASTKTIKAVVSSMLNRAKMRMKASNSLGVRSHIAGAKHIPVDAMTSRDRHAARISDSTKAATRRTIEKLTGQKLAAPPKPAGDPHRR